MNLALFTVVVGALLSIVNALPIPTEDAPAVEVNIDPQPLQILYDLVEGDNDSSEGQDEQTSSTTFYTCSSGSDSATELTSSDFQSVSDRSEDKKEQAAGKESEHGMRVFLPGLGR